MMLLRILRRHLWSGPSRTFGEAIPAQRAAFDRARLLVQLFYAIALFWAIIDVPQWPRLARVEGIDPQWPIFWIDRVGIDPGVDIICGFALATALVAACVPHWRIARFAYALALLEYMALINSFGAISHNRHVWLYAAWALVLLPTRRNYAKSRIPDRHYFLTVFWVVQLVVLFAYTLTGIWKIHHGFISLFNEDTSGFHPRAFSLIIGERLLQTDQDTVLGEWFVRNPFPGWVLYSGTIYLEAASVLIAFRPRLHKIWGIGLLLFHIGTQVAMGFTFDRNLPLLGLLFLCSPVLPDVVTVKEAFLDVPGIHFLWRGWEALRKRQRTPTPLPAPVTTP